MNAYAWAKCYLLLWSQRHGVAITLADEPARDRWRRKERDIARKLIERLERQMIEVRMRQEDRIELREVLERDTWWCDTRQEAAKALFIVGIGDDAHTTDLQEQRRMTDIRYQHQLTLTGFQARRLAGWTTIAPCLPRSRASNHC